MKTQVLNNCQGPHYIQLQKVGNAPPQTIILHPGINLVDTKQLAEARKVNATFERLFSETIKPSKSPEADPRTFGKAMLEVVGKELADKAPISGLPRPEATAIIGMTQNTDLLKSWRDDCDPAKQSDLVRVLNDRIKEVAALVGEG